MLIENEIGVASGTSATNLGPPPQTHQEANLLTATKPPSPLDPIPEARSRTPSIQGMPRDTELAGQILGDDHKKSASQTPLPGHASAANQTAIVGQNLSDEGLFCPDTQTSSALIGEITALHRRYEDLRRAKQRVELQAMAMCRVVAGGDKVEGAKLYRAPTPQLSAWLIPYHAAMEPLNTSIAENEKLLEKLGKKLPVVDWAKGVSGLSFRFLTMIVGECAIAPGEYRSSAALWKRMGMAVIGSERQRRVTGDAAVAHGYVARRRSLMWNIGNSILKQQIRSEKNEKSAKIEGTDFAKGPLGEAYLARKAYLREKNEAGGFAERAAQIAKDAKRFGKTPHPTNLEGRLTRIHIHNDAKRYMEKRLLRELWKAWRHATV